VTTFVVESHGEEGPRAVADSDVASTATATSAPPAPPRTTSTAVAPKSAFARPPDDDDEEESKWVSPWGASAFSAGTLALLQASLLGVWWLTIALGILGLALVGQGIVATGRDRQLKDRMWFTLGSLVNIGVLGVALIAPGLLNRYWAMTAVPPHEDPQQIMMVGRTTPQEKGTPIGAADWGDGRDMALRQESVFMRVESVKAGSLPGKADGSVLIHLRIQNARHERTITIEPFSNDGHRPVLTDEAGRAFPFVEQKLRKPAKGAPVFIVDSRVVELNPDERQEYLLVFAAAGRWEKLKLEMPASAWGQKGAFKFRIPGHFSFQ
jgi:hypothetical protein